MKAIAKQNFENKFVEAKWTKGNHYSFYEDKEKYQIVFGNDNDLENINICFCGDMKDMEDQFEFVEEE
jgi:hypothetical protein